ncbi:hypothetical protein HWV62_13934 [Athelia sp. TMB]|nr:hypothetical protein HWV62_44492 [Athelia sp. TMB]KAF7973964.1 hypothetical protein HWV62_13934 [Athelia sp. TMB]
MADYHPHHNQTRSPWAQLDSPIELATSPYSPPPTILNYFPTPPLTMAPLSPEQHFDPYAFLPGDQAHDRDILDGQLLNFTHPNPPAPYQQHPQQHPQWPFLSPLHTSDASPAFSTPSQISDTGFLSPRMSDPLNTPSPTSREYPQLPYSPHTGSLGLSVSIPPQSLVAVLTPRATQFGKMHLPTDSPQQGATSSRANFVFPAPAPATPPSAVSESFPSSSSLSRWAGAVHTGGGSAPASPAYSNSFAPQHYTEGGHYSPYPNHPPQTPQTSYTPQAPYTLDDAPHHHDEHDASSSPGSTGSANALGHAEQLRLWKTMPITAPIAPGQQRLFLPQRMYRPHTTSDRRRYVALAALSPPILFECTSPLELGLPLDDALKSRTRRLVDRDAKVFEGCGPSVSIRIEWPGVAGWSRQIPTRDFRAPPGPITRAKLAKNVAKCVQRFMVDTQGRPLEVDGADGEVGAAEAARWRTGSRVRFEDLILVSLHHVSQGSWQPHLRLRQRAA